MNDDVALLTRLIQRLQPKLDAGAAARRLLTVHGSLGAVLEAEPQDLSRVTGLSATSAQALALIPQLARYVAGERAQAMTTLDTFERAGAYVKGLYLGVNNECFYLLCLDGVGRLLDCALVQQGTVDEAPFYLRRILERALRSGASAVVLSHNHPSGTAIFSPADIQCTHEAVGALLPLGVAVLDHILVADGKPYTLHGNLDFPEVLFTRQRPGDPLIAGWLRAQEANE